MNSSSLLIVCCLIFAQSIHAYYPYGGYLGAYPGFGYDGLAGPYLGAAGYGAYGYPYGFGYYHPRTALRNTAQSYRREDGHLSDTSIISPFRKNKN